ncbi:MAG: DUF3817 domain-containing protein [Shimia sp.]
MEASTLITLMLIIPQAERLKGIDWLSSVMGALHGTAFLWWLSILIEGWTFGLLRLWAVPIGIVLAMVPTGTIWLDLYLRRSWRHAV